MKRRTDNNKITDNERREQQQASEDMIFLCGCAVNGKVPETEQVKTTNLAALYRIADQHMLVATVAVALESAGIRDTAFSVALAKAIRKTVIVDAETTALLARLEDAGIWYMPLKGALLKDLYPVYGMREMSDRDILFDASRAEEVRELMQSLGYEVDDFDREHHDSYVKEPVTRIEMHRRLISHWKNETMYRYYADVKSRLLKDSDNEYGWHFSPDDFYIYMIAHEYKHYSLSGTGVRSLLDTYVYLKNVPINEDYVATETKKLGISEFEQANRKLAVRLFGKGTLTESDRKMLDYTVASGVFGTEKHRAENVLTEKGRTGYFRSRLTIPYERMQELYPALRKSPVLYPFCWAHRLIHAFFFKNKTVMYQLKAGLKWKEKKPKE